MGNVMVVFRPRTAGALATSAEATDRQGVQRSTFDGVLTKVQQLILYVRRISFHR
jgi:hypothetical protein